MQHNTQSKSYEIGISHKSLLTKIYLQVKYQGHGDCILWKVIQIKVLSNISKKMWKKQDQIAEINFSSTKTTHYWDTGDFRVPQH